MKPIESMFPRVIWQRGQDYYRRDKVKNVEILNEFVRAKVIGTETYHVEIHYKKSSVGEMYCDCAHAAGGNNCKHMAALLIKMEQLGIVNSQTLAKEQGNPHTSNDWYDIVLDCVAGRSWINQIQENRFQDAFITCLFEDIAMLEQGNYDDILQDLSHMIKALNRVNEKISIDKILLILPQIFQKLRDLSLHVKGRKWARQQSLETNRVDLFEFLIQRAFTMDQQGLKEMDDYIKGAKDNKKFQIVQACLVLKIKVMKQLKYDEAIIVESLAEFSNFEFVVEYKIAYYMENKIYDRAKKLLTEYAKVPTINREKRDEIHYQLAEIAIIEKAYNECFQFIKERLSNPHSKIPTKYTLELKTSYPTKQEWKNFLWAHARELKSEIPYYRLVNYYQYIEEYDCYYELIIERFDISNLLENIKELMEYDEAMYQLVFTMLIKQEMQEASKASQYGAIITYIKDFMQYSQNQNTVDEIVIYAREHYANKKVLMNYLKELY